MDHEELLAILRQSKAANPLHGITGVLCYSEGIFLQVLEGGRSAVNRLYNRIVADARHREVCRWPGPSATPDKWASLPSQNDDRGSLRNKSRLRLGSTLLVQNHQRTFRHHHLRGLPWHDPPP